MGSTRTMAPPSQHAATTSPTRDPRPPTRPGIRCSAEPSRSRAGGRASLDLATGFRRWLSSTTGESWPFRLQNVRVRGLQRAKLRLDFSCQELIANVMVIRILGKSSGPVTRTRSSSTTRPSSRTRATRLSLCSRLSCRQNKDRCYYVKSGDGSGGMVAVGG